MDISKLRATECRNLLEASFGLLRALGEIPDLDLPGDYRESLRKHQYEVHRFLHYPRRPKQRQGKTNRRPNRGA